MAGEHGNSHSDPRGSLWGTRLFYALAAACIVLLLADLLYHKHVHYAFEGWFGFYAVFGLLSYLFIVFAAKGLRKLVKREERYYDEDAPGAPGSEPEP